MALLIVGVTEDGATAFSTPLDHGADPDAVVFDQGYKAVRPLDADWNSEDLGLRLLVRPLAGETRPNPTPPRTDAGLIIADDVVPVTRQRVAAYAVVLSAQGLLATEYSVRTAVPGRWGMPGGGMDDHESPTDCVRREVHEGTAQQIVLGELTKVQTGTGSVASRAGWSKTFTPSGWSTAPPAPSRPNRWCWITAAAPPRPAGSVWTPGPRCPGPPTG